MLKLRLIAGLLLIADGILHLASFAANYHRNESGGLLLFGILYGAAGLLLFHKKRYALYPGILIPAIGMTASLIKFGTPALLSMSALFKFLGFVAVICCLIVLACRKPS